MATTEDYVAVGDQGHMYVRHQDTQSRNIQIASGHHGPSASPHYFAPNLASNKYTLQAASSSIGVSNSQQYIAPRIKISMPVLDRAYAYAPAHPTQPSYQSSTPKKNPTYLDVPGCTSSPRGSIVSSIRTTCYPHILQKFKEEHGKKIGTYAKYDDPVVRKKFISAAIDDVQNLHTCKSVGMFLSYWEMVMPAWCAMGEEKLAKVFHDYYIAPVKKAPGVFWHYNATEKYGLYPSNNPLEAF
jgi:hypothetical protein